MKKYSKLKQLNGLKKVCILTHVNPDNDAVCSSIVMSKFIKSQFKVKNVDIFADNFEKFSGCKYFDNYVNICEPKSKYDCVIMMDANESSRLGKYESVYLACKNRICIDHHTRKTTPAETYIHELVSSTCEIVYDICAEYGYALTKADYGMIYAGLISDTGCFAVGDVDKHAYEIAGECVEHIDQPLIYEKCFSEIKPVVLDLYAKLIKNKKSYFGGQLIYSIIKKDKTHIFENYSYAINNLQYLQGCKICIVVEPIESGYYVHLRAKRGYDVSGIANENGGGGHRGASAFKTQMSARTLEKFLVAELGKQLTENPVETNDIFG